jgi:hypothetical protein
VSRARISLIASIVTVALAFAGCGGGSSKVSAAAYVKSVCTSVGAWVRDVQSRGTQVQAANLTNPSQGKSELQRFMAAVLASTDKVLGQVKSAGVPNVTGGQGVENSLVNAFTQAKTVLERAATSVSQLPINDATAFKNAATQLGNSVNQSLTAIGTSLSGLSSSTALKAAGTKEPACQSIIAGG